MRLVTRSVCSAVFALLLCVPVLGVSPAIAQPRTIRGIVMQLLSSAPPRVMIKTTSETVTVTVTESGSVERVRFADLRVGDEVIASITERNEALSILVLTARVPPVAQATPQVQGSVGVWVDSSVTPPRDHCLGRESRGSGWTGDRRQVVGG